MKPSRMMEHLNKKHASKAAKDLSFFQQLNAKKSQLQLLPQSTKRATNEDGMVASYKISNLIAQSGKPHSIGESLLVPAMSELITTVLHQNPTEILKRVPLSNDTVRRRIDEMAGDVEAQLITKLQHQSFSLQIDESTLSDSQSLLLGYVRFIEAEDLREELLFALDLITDTKGETIFSSVKTYLKKQEIPLHNITSCATDGAPSMVGKYRGFTAFLKKEVPHVFNIHCIIHRQHLAAKKLSPELNETLTIVIRAVNFIKSHALNDRLFRQLCQDNNEDSVRLLLHTDVRWLSKGRCLNRFYDLFDSVNQFLQSSNKELYQQLCGKQHDIAYLADIFDKCNALITQLQGEKVGLVSARASVLAFMGKLQLYDQSLCRREFYHFACLGNHEDVTDNELLVYSAHLKSLKADMETRFADLLSMAIPDWLVDPFTVTPHVMPLPLQEEIVELQSNVAAKLSFNIHGNVRFWILTTSKMEYPQLCKAAERFVLPFPTSYLAERGFSAVTHILSKSRNRLDITGRGDLRLMLSKMEPDVAKLAKEHQSQGSH
jgi:hypothetical protein